MCDPQGDSQGDVQEMRQNRTVIGKRRGQVLAVMSVYRPSEEAVSNAARAVSQADRVIVIDDGSGTAFRERLDDIRAVGAQVLSLDANRGIAAALNEGIRALAPGAGDVIVTLDQDSRLPDGFVSTLLKTLSDAETSGLPVAIVAPESFAGVSQKGVRLPGGFDEALRPIQSGMLVTAAALEDLGLLDEGLFIDLVDVEYYLRAVQGAWVSVAARGLDLPHELGRHQSMSIMGRRISTTLSTPFRYYYRTRNRVIITRRYSATARTLLRSERFRDTAHFAVAVLFARPRADFLRLLRLGWRDGRSNRVGKIPPEAMALAAGISWRGEPLPRSSAAG